MGTACRVTAPCLVGAALLLAATAMVRAEPTPVAAVALDELKRAYMWCDSAAMKGRLETAAIARCSVIYEDLKRRAFDGDFERLLAWSRAQQARRSTD